MGDGPVNLDKALASFAAIWSPRVVARMNDYDIRIAHAKGDHVWHVHQNTDEFSWFSMGGSTLQCAAAMVRSTRWCSVKGMPLSSREVSLTGPRRLGRRS